jgi:hypothetical protein
MKKRKAERGKLTVPEDAIPLGDIKSQIANRYGLDTSELIREVMENVKDSFKRRLEAWERLKQSLTHLENDQWLVRGSFLREQDAASDQLYHTVCAQINWLFIQLQSRVPQRRETNRDEEIWRRYYDEHQTAERIASDLTMEPAAVRKVIQRMKRTGRKAPDKRRKK